MHLPTLFKISFASLLFMGVLGQSLAKEDLPKGEGASCSCSMGFADIVQRVLPAVVDISSRHMADKKEQKISDIRELMQIPDVQSSPLAEMMREWTQGGEVGQLPLMNHSLGSGFIIDPKGYIVTNRHVIQDADEIIVSLSDGREMKATIIARDSRTDLALLKVETKEDLPFLKWGDSKSARVGDWILVVGSPFGFGRSVSAGIISARARDISRTSSAIQSEGIMGGYVDDLIQSDAAINLGNSGGPMVNTKGEVIGVNVAIFSPSGGSVGIGFAVPSLVAARALDHMKQHGHASYGWIGIRVQEIRLDNAKALGFEREIEQGTQGALISQVDAMGPAAKAGILPGDIILSFDGKDIKTYERLPRLVGETDVGKKVIVEIWRAGKRISIPLVVSAWTADEKDTSLLNAPVEHTLKIPLTLKSPGVSYESFLSLQVTPLTHTFKKQLNVLTDVEGVVIIGINQFSQGESDNLKLPPLDLQLDDVIEAVDQTKIKTPADLEQIFERLLKEGKKTFLLKIWRDGIVHYIALNLETDDALKENVDIEVQTPMPLP